MKYNISNNWIETFELIKKRPVILFPFAIVAFLEGLAFELIYFFPRKPISFIANPIIKKFFGETFVHYPGNLILLPRLFYYLQIVIYIVIGVFLTAITINIFKNIRSKLPLKTNALIKNALKSYPSFLTYGIVIVVLTILSRRTDMIILSKLFKFASDYAPNRAAQLFPFISPMFLFLTNALLHVFFILALPLFVIEKKSLFKALAGSIYMGACNFFSIFILIFIPLLLYLPISLLKSFQPVLINKTFPEITLYITIVGIIVAMLIDCFITICAAQFLLDKTKVK